MIPESQVLYSLAESLKFARTIHRLTYLHVVWNKETVSPQRSRVTVDVVKLGGHITFRGQLDCRTFLLVLGYSVDDMYRTDESEPHPHLTSAVD